MSEGIVELGFKRDIYIEVRHVPGNPPEVTSITIEGLGDDLCIENIKTKMASLTTLAEDLAWDRQEELEKIIDDYLEEKKKERKADKKFPRVTYEDFII